MDYSADSKLIWQGTAPCSPFRRFVCALRPFWVLCMRPAALSTLYMHPAALSDPLHMHLATLSVGVSVSLYVCVCISLLKGF